MRGPTNPVFFSKIIWLREENWCPLAEGAVYWMRWTVEMDAFVSNKDESSSIVAIAGPTWKRDPLIRNKRLVGVGGEGDVQL